MRSDSSHTVVDILYSHEIRLHTHCSIHTVQSWNKTPHTHTVVYILYSHEAHKTCFIFWRGGGVKKCYSIAPLVTQIKDLYCIFSPTSSNQYDLNSFSNLVTAQNRLIHHRLDWMTMLSLWKTSNGAVSVIFILWHSIHCNEKVGLVVWHHSIAALLHYWTHRHSRTYSRRPACQCEIY